MSVRGMQGRPLLLLAGAWVVEALAAVRCAWERRDAANEVLWDREADDLENLKKRHVVFSTDNLIAQAHIVVTIARPHCRSKYEKVAGKAIQDRISSLLPSHPPTCLDPP